LVTVRDEEGRPTQEQLPNGVVRSTTYTGSGLVKTQSQNGSTTTFAYDLGGALVAISEPHGLTQFSYDELGRLRWRAWPGGQCANAPYVACTRYSYNLAGEVTEIDYSDQTVDVSNVQRDAVGRVTRFTDGSGTSQRSYDSLGRLYSSTDGFGETVGYRYDLASNLTKLAYPGGNCDSSTPTLCVTRTYDDASRWVAVTDWLGNTTSFNPDADGNYTT
jgi:YD repeat-containing protein